MLDPLWNLENNSFLRNKPFDCSKISWGLKKRLSEHFLSDWPGPPPPPDENSWIRAWPIYTRLKIVDTSQGDRTIIVPSPWGYRPMSVRFYEPCMGIVRRPCGDLAGTLRRAQESTIIFGQKWQSKIARRPHDYRTMHVRGSYDVSAMCLRATGLRFFSNLSLC